VWQIVPSNLNITANSVVIVGDPNQHITNVGASTSQTQFTLVNTTQAKATLADAPHWATLIQDCEASINRYDVRAYSINLQPDIQVLIFRI